MTLKTLLSSMILALVPALGFAQGCSGDRSAEQAMSCAEGSAYDVNTGTCVPLETS